MSDKQSFKGLLSLNPPQQKAVKSTEGRVLILAGAGSGKTSVLAHRIAYLIEHLKVPSEHILGLTFTQKAAQEMRHRVGHIINAKAAEQVMLCTFHSFCMQVLRKEIQVLGYTPHFSVYDEKDVKRLIKQISHQILEHEGDLPSLEDTIEKLSHLKSRGNPSQTESSDWHTRFVQDLLTRLHVCMRAYNAVDFDNLLLLTVEIFEKFPEILEKYQTRFHYIMIDEYQDTNPIQYRLAQLLSARHHNLCVVGDDDQSIYGWRGADIQNILKFEATTLIKLEQNYRSTPIILQAANAVIAHNTERHDKQLWSAHEKGEAIVLFHAPTETDEALSIAQRLVWLHKHKNIPWRDMAVLYRSNILSRAIEMALLQTVWEKEGRWIRGIPYQVFGGTELYERSEIKDVAAYLKFICNPLDQEALLRIINVPRRGISEQTLDILTQVNRQKQIPLWDLIKSLVNEQTTYPELKIQLSKKALSGLTVFAGIIDSAQQKFQHSSLSSALEWFLSTVDYQKAIAEDVKSEKMRSFKWDNVLQLVESLRSYEEEKNTNSSLAHFLSEMALDRSKIHFKETSAKSIDAVNLMTFHSAKGLEFAGCFLVGLENHIIPHEKSIQERGLEEERRLFYVALTRAKKYLTLSMSRNRKYMGKEKKSSPSRFLFEIPSELLKISSWQTIEY